MDKQLKELILINESVTKGLFLLYVVEELSWKQCLHRKNGFKVGDDDNENGKSRKSPLTTDDLWVTYDFFIISFFSSSVSLLSAGISCGIYEIPPVEFTIFHYSSMNEIH